MRIASFNVNSVRLRIEMLRTWLKEQNIDVLCLQEIKCQDEAFPKLEFEELGYNLITHGQKTFNGVAIFSKHPVEDVRRGLPGMEDDEQARYIEAVISNPEGAFRVASIYAPNGNPLGTDKFPYKLKWLNALHGHAEKLLSFEEPLVLAGDYNIIPKPIDCHDPKVWTNDALFQPESRAAFRGLENLGLTDAFRACNDEAKQYTFWDYQAGAWQKNNGIRIDHLLLSPQAADKLTGCIIDKSVRALEKPSDHVPIIGSFSR